MKKNDINQTTDNEIITLSRKEYEALQAQSKRISELESHVEMLMEALRLARHKQYGASSEKSTDSLAEQLCFLFNEAEVFVEEKKEEEETQNNTVVRKPHKKHVYTLDKLPENIAEEQIEHRLEAEERICRQCGEEMREIGKETVNTLKIIPARVIVQQHIYYTYACERCNKEGIETPIVKAARERKVIPGSFAAPEAIAHIMTQKFVMGVPIYRQEQDLKRQGIPLSRQSMSNWILRASEEYLRPVYDLLHKELLRREVLHADETTLQVLHEPGKKAQSESYMWLYRTGGDTDRPIVLYEYCPGRSAQYPEKFLQGYAGYLHTDGYAGYHSLPEEITPVGCWAHARRKFDEAVKSLPKGQAKGSAASQGLSYCNLLFDLEAGMAELSAEERYRRRLEQEKPVLDAFLSWVNERNAAPKSALGKALTYVKEQWPYLSNYLKDGRLEISNNRAERSIKPFVIDRKNFLFANTPRGATGSAVIFSLIQTAMENELDPYLYLSWLMTICKDEEIKEKEILLPWNAPAECRVKMK